MSSFTTVVATWVGFRSLTLSLNGGRYMTCNLTCSLPGGTVLLMGLVASELAPALGAGAAVGVVAVVPVVGKPTGDDLDLRTPVRSMWELRSQALTLLRGSSSGVFAVVSWLPL